MKKSLIYKLKIASLCLFAFSLGIEYWDPLGVRATFTLTKFAGFIYTLLSLFNINKNFAITTYNKLLIYCGLLLWFWLMFISLIYSSIIGGDIFLFSGVLQNVILFWLVFNDIINNPKIRNHIFLSIVAGMVLVSILLTLGVGIENIHGDYIDDIDNTRIYFMGMNPNRMGDLAAISILLIFSSVFSNISLNRMRYLLLLAIPSLLSIIGISASRGSFFLVFIGLFVFFILKKGGVIQKVIFFIIGGISILIIMQFMNDFALLQDRLSNSSDAGGRLEIWRNVFVVVQENIAFGAGQGGYNFKMIQFYGQTKDPHNIFLFVWAVGGLIGLLILLIFYFKIFKNCWTNLKINNDVTNIMLFLTSVFLVSKSGGALELKLVWLIFACIAPIINRKETLTVKQ